MTYDKASFLAGLRTGLALPRIPKEKPKATYLTFLSEDSSEFTLSVYNSSKNWDGTLYYSTDTTNWTIWAGTPALNSNGGALYLRGEGNTVITGNNQRARFSFSFQSGIQCIGNIECLLDWETVIAQQHPHMADYCFAYLFYSCSLTTAPELPATILSAHCYDNLFYNCRQLRTPPELPATNLQEGCYYAMFRQCMSLATAPLLPATTLANACYYQMFSSCTSLTSPPALPATEVAPYCYYYMFSSCISLKSAPELPATTLAEGCYVGMFGACESLRNAPILRAMTLASSCYGSMFYGCISLISAPELPATTLAVSCYADMFQRCTFTTPPKLLATNLASMCYRQMFRDCLSLTTLPELPSTNLPIGCYESMFYGCTSLTLSTTQDSTYAHPYRIPTSGNGTAALYALRNMFDGTGGPFTGTPSINTVYYTDHPPIPAA